MPGFGDGQKSVIAATILGVRLVNVYVVNGQAVGSEKYAYKLRWLAALHDYLREINMHFPKLAVMGDFNVAPTPADTHDPELWEGNILCSEPERAGLKALFDVGLRDAYETAAQREGHFTWWDYRQAAFQRDLGLRIDHILLSPSLTAAAWRVDTAPRKLARPAAHAPVTTEISS